MTIWKFHVPIGAERSTEIKMPTGAEIVHVGAQHTNLLTFWAKVDKTLPTEPRTFKVVGTGHEFLHRWQYVGSVFMGPFVWHLLEVAPRRIEEHKHAETKN